MNKDRTKGMLWGLVVGDCLGSPIQFKDKDDHPWITEMEPCAKFRVPAGYWTDDSSMAMCIMESFTRLGKYDRKDIADNFVRWFYHGFLSSKDVAFDVGGATADACRAIRKTGSLVNGRESSQGNGSIMRFAPSYLLANGDRSIMYAISDLTHSSKAIHKVIDRMAGILDQHLLGVKTDGLSAYKTRDEVDNSGWAVSTLEAALWAFNTTSSFEEGMIAAVNLGGDSDTIGAVYGQLAGAYYGFAAIPERWVKAVKTWEQVDQLIEEFAGKLLKVV